MSNNELIFSAYAYSGSMKSSVNVSDNADKISLYLKNAFVALTSAKTNNPQCDVALITNIDIPDNYKSLYSRFDILIFKRDFNDFVFDNEYTWGLAFYKLCAIDEAIKKGYENYLIIDSDSYVQSPLDDLWTETKDNIMLYDINHRLSVKNCTNFNSEISLYTGIQKPLTNFGGEFIAGNRELLYRFITECKSIYDDMIEKNYRTSFGDEFIISIIAEKLRPVVKNAGGYVFRFWTGNFYLSCTCYKYNPVSVFHVPAEKSKGMIRIYNYVVKHGRLPEAKKIYNILHLNKRPYKYVALDYLKPMIKK